MRLKSVSLTNVCQHRDLHLEFPLGVTGLFGGNGTGKSNLIKMVKASLTGKFPNGREANICRLDYVTGDYPRDYVSTVTTVWEHTGSDIVVTRNLRATTRDELTVGGRVSTKSKDVTARVSAVFGVPLHVIDEFLFVDQWSIFSFLSSTAASRGKTFSHLCGTAHVEKVWDALGRQASGDAVYVYPDDVASLEAITSRIRSKVRKSKKVERAIAEAKLFILPEDEVEGCRASIVASQAGSTLSTKLASRKQELETLEETVSVLGPSDVSFGKERLLRLQGDVIDLTTDVARLKKTIKLLKESCPTCGRLLGNEAEYIKAVTPLKAEGREKASRLKELQLELEPLEAQADISAATEDKRNTILRKMELSRAVIADTEEAITELDVLSESELFGYTNSVLAHDQAVVAVSMDIELVKDLRVDLASLREDKQFLEDRADISKIAKKWIDDLDALRKIFHRDALPKFIANHFLRTLVAKINETLESFESPFSVTAEDDLSFSAHKPNGVVEPADRLSGGEKVVLALSFRLAINSLFGGEVGMMVLDEPTAGLDEHNLGCLADVLAKLCDLTRKKGQQIIMITHEARLQRVFDNVIHLGDDVHENKE